MFKILRKIKNYFLISVAVGVFLFFIFFSFLNPLTLESILSGADSLAQGAGGSATVAVNPINKIAMQLEVKEKTLNEREVNLKELENRIIKRNDIFHNKLLLGVLIVLGAVVVLILVNFYLDFKRKRSNKDEKSSFI